MASSSHLDHEQRRTLEQISGHPLPRNLKWRPVIALLEAMGDEFEEHDDRIRVKIDGHTEVFHHSGHGDVPAETVVKLRHFLLGTEPEPDQTP